MSTQRGKEAAGENTGWRGFVDVRLPQGIEWEQVAEEVPNESMFAVIQELVGAGMKVSVSYSASNDAFVCSLTGQRRAGKNQGYTMTTWSNQLERAICGAWYKHFVLRGGGSWSDGKQQSMFEL